MEDLGCQAELIDVATEVWRWQQVPGRRQKYDRPLSTGELRDMRKYIKSRGTRRITAFRSTTHRIYDGDPIRL
jgi:hypothetical protein